jgi:glycosyltransferase involved in cell wall biosynthesis
MKILVIADPNIPVPPVDYGGTERIVHLLCRELQEMGHRVCLIAGPGSRDYGGGLYLHTRPTLGYHSRAYRKLLFQAISLWAVRGIDAVVNFGRVDYLEGLLRTKVPLLNCFPNPVSQSEVDWLLGRRSTALRLIGISRAQFKSLETNNLVDIIYNATDTQILVPTLRLNSSPYLVFLGRVTANKGADTAIAVARRSGMPLKLAGTIMDHDLGGRRFFEEKIRPELGEDVEYVGPVDDIEKRRLLGEARALLFPIRWPEPFGIVMAESLACGTPVIATRVASVPEVIEHGSTGFVVDTEEQMADAVAHLGVIDRAACRRSAENRFSPRRMAEGYLASIESLLQESPHSLQATMP